MQNQPLARALGQLGKDMFRESPRMFPVAVPDYVRFGPINGLRLFGELTRYPSLERLKHTPVPTLAVLGVRDPLIPSADRVREVAGLAPEQLAVAVVDKAAHAVNFSHPEELAGIVDAWLDDPEVRDVRRLPAGVRFFAAGTGSDAISRAARPGHRPLGPARPGRGRRSRGRSR